jgi:hypothetical protein
MTTASMILDLILEAEEILDDASFDENSQEFCNSIREHLHHLENELITFDV